MSLFWVLRSLPSMGVISLISRASYTSTQEAVREVSLSVYQAREVALKSTPAMSKLTFSFLALGKVYPQNLNGLKLFHAQCQIYFPYRRRLKNPRSKIHVSKPEKSKAQISNRPNPNISKLKSTFLTFLFSLQRPTPQAQTL